MRLFKLRKHLKECREIIINLETELKYLNDQISINNITDYNHEFYHRKFTVLRNKADCIFYILTIKDLLQTLSKA